MHTYYEDGSFRVWLGKYTLEVSLPNHWSVGMENMLLAVIRVTWFVLIVVLAVDAVGLALDCVWGVKCLLGMVLSVFVCVGSLVIIFDTL